MLTPTPPRKLLFQKLLYFFFFAHDSICTDSDFLNWLLRSENRIFFHDHILKAKLRNSFDISILFYLLIMNTNQGSATFNTYRDAGDTKSSFTLQKGTALISTHIMVTAVLNINKLLGFFLA